MPTYKKSRNIIPIAFLYILLVVSSCTGDAGKSNSQPTPTVTQTFTNPVPRDLVAIDVEIDTPPLYRLGHEVALAVASKIDDLATRVNSSGMVIFGCRISSMSWQDCPISFRTPSIDAWVLPPLDPATHCPPDPFQCSKYKQKYKKALADWKIVHAGQVRALEQTRSYIHTQTDKIRDMRFPWDNRWSDIYGALATCAANLQGINAQFKYCLLATDYISTTQQQGSFSLAGIHVVSIFRTSSDNAFNQQSNSFWGNVCRRAGALSFDSYSVPQSQALGLQLPD